MEGGIRRSWCRIDRESLGEMNMDTDTRCWRSDLFPRETASEEHILRLFLRKQARAFLFSKAECRVFNLSFPPASARSK